MIAMAGHIFHLASKFINKKGSETSLATNPGSLKFYSVRVLSQWLVKKRRCTRINV